MFIIVVFENPVESNLASHLTKVSGIFQVLGGALGKGIIVGSFASLAGML